MQNIRTCPYCGYHYSKHQYFRYVFSKFIWTKWKCANCKNLISFNRTRWTLTAIFKLGWLYFIFLLRDYTNGSLFGQIGLVALLVVGLLSLSLLITFKKES